MSLCEFVNGIYIHGCLYVIRIYRNKQSTKKKKQHPRVCLNTLYKSVGDYAFWKNYNLSWAKNKGVV